MPFENEEQYFAALDGGQLNDIALEPEEFSAALDAQHPFAKLLEEGQIAADSLGNTVNNIRVANYFDTSLEDIESSLSSSHSDFDINDLW